MSTRINEIDRIISDIGVEVEAALRSDRIGLQEAPEPRRVHAGAVVVEPARLRIDALAGVAEGSRHGRALAEGLVARFRQRSRGGIERSLKRALDVGNEGGSRRGREVDLVQRLVRPEAVGVPAQDLPRRAAIFQNLAVVGVGDEESGRSVDGFALAPP